MIINLPTTQASSSASASTTSGGGAATGMPSVAEVFGGLSEQEIADQVQMGQQFLQELKANGSPEEIEAFMNMLANTVNSMSDEDWKDIEAISEMVQPLITIPEEPIIPITTDSKAEKPKDVVKPESNATEVFKQLISNIIQRIDDIIQKINSSKECADEMDTKWKNKSTFSNMKRQIYQLRTDRLAEKLGKKDISGEEKDLVDVLKKYLADLTEHNDKLVIEDNFGLPASYTAEKKHLKQTTAFLDMSDEYIDQLMPKLEKFFRKYDPEALQMAKEAEEQSKKASKSATDATVRRPSVDARSLPTTPSGSKSYSPTDSGYQNYGGGYDDYGQPYSYGGYSSPEETKGGSKSKSESTTPKAKEIAPTPKTAEPKKNKDHRYQDIVSDLEDHLKDDYPTSHENKFVQFLQSDLVGLYPSSHPTLPTFTSYTTDIIDRLKKDFTKEFASLDNILTDMEDNIHKMSTDELKKLQSAKELTSLEARLKHYKNAFEGALLNLDNQYQKNNQPLNTKYENAHKDFIRTITIEVSDKIESLFGTINKVKRKARRNANRKQDDEKSP